MPAEPLVVPAPPRTTARHDPLLRALRLLDVRPAQALRAVFFGFLALGSAVALAATSAWLIARASQMPPILTLQVTIVAVRAFGISRAVFRYLERLASHDVALRGMATLRARVYDRLAGGRHDAVATLRRGDLLERVGADVDHVGDVVVRGLVPIAVSTCVSVTSVGAMALVLPAAAGWLAAGLVLASVVGPWLTARGAARTEHDASQARADVTTVSLDLLEHAAQLTVSGGTARASAALREADARWRRSTDRGGRDTAAGAAIGFLGLAVAVVGAIWAGVPAVTDGRLADVALAVLVLTPLAAFESTTLLPAAAVQVRRSRLAAARLMSLWDAAGPIAAPEVPDPCAPGAGEGPSTIGPPASPRPAEALLSTRALVVGRDGRAACAVPDVDLAVGGSLVLTGASGAGKTTALATLAGLLPAVRGTSSRDPRATVALTTEDAHVFATTVLENLRVARGDVTAPEAVEALEGVGLGTWLRGLPDGLSTVLGSDGATVSGGERRRLLVARALLSRADVLLFDEPAEHLDPATADALVADLLRLPTVCGPGSAPQVRGVVVATHHLGAVAGADVVLDLTPVADAAPRAAGGVPRAAAGSGRIETSWTTTSA